MNKQHGMLIIKDYHNILPISLHKEADEFLYYLKTFPFEKPISCIHCGSKVIFFTGYISNEGIRTYHCSHCKKSFNQLTGTLFARSGYLDKWADFAFWYLSGLTSIEIAKKTGVSKNTALRRSKKLLLMMQDFSPRLYNWWQSHQNRQDQTMSKLVEEQKNYFLDWLKTQVTMDHIACPYCASHRCYRTNKNRPQFCCWQCLKSFNPLEKTPFRRMHFIHLWPIYFEKLVRGLLQRDISAELNISRRSLILWKNAFIKQMAIMKLDALMHWMIWQNKRRVQQAKKE